jgi:hypothetical protein
VAEKVLNWPFIAKKLKKTVRKAREILSEENNLDENNL